MGHGNQATANAAVEQRQGAQAAKGEVLEHQGEGKLATETQQQEQTPISQTIPPPFRLLMSKVVSGALEAAVRLRLPDIMKDGEPRTVEDIAAQCGAQPEALYRLMRCLTNDGIFVEHENRRFTLGENGQYYRTDHPMSINDLAQLWCGSAFTKHWDCLFDRVMTGETCNQELYGGLSLLDYWMKPENHAAFMQFHDNVSRLSVPAILDAYKDEWRKYDVICDVCGGNDFLLAEVLKHGNPYARGILFDDEPIAEMARATQERLGVADRVECIGGNVFEEVPMGVDLFMIKQTVHPWDDETVVKMLKNCKESLNRGGKILIMDAVMPDEPNTPDMSKYLDMLHMVHSRGRERTEAEMRAVCDQAGLRVLRIIRPATGILPIIETEPK